ncbi:MAG: T9SS type A sorting domain-containing protein [Flavobacteriales bacterium]
MRTLFALLLTLAPALLWAQDDCDVIDFQGAYLHPYSDTTLFVAFEITDPEYYINYPNLRVYANDGDQETFLGEVPAAWQTFAWTGPVVATISLEVLWSDYFSMEGDNPELRLEIWSNFFTEVVCETTVDASEGGFFPFSNDHESSDCEEQLAGSMYGTATWGQAATVHVLLERMIDGIPVDPPVVDVFESWADVAQTHFFCLDPTACYQLTVTPQEVGPSEYWLTINSGGEWYENWTWVTMEGLDPLVLDLSPYGGIACSALSVSEEQDRNTPVVYPQPARNRVTIEGLDAQPAEVRIYSQTGALVNSELLVGSVLELDHLAPGIYILEVVQGTLSHRQQVIFTD